MRRVEDIIIACITSSFAASSLRQILERFSQSTKNERPNAAELYIAQRSSIPSISEQPSEANMMCALRICYFRSHRLCRIADIGLVMRTNKRQDTRQRLNYMTTVVTANGTRHECRFTDISASGARLEVKNPSQLPDEFILMLSERGKVMRRCEVIWRSEKYLGVRFRLH